MGVRVNSGLPIIGCIVVVISISVVSSVLGSGWMVDSGCPSVDVTLGSSLSAWYQWCWRQRAFRVPISGCIIVVITISGVSSVWASACIQGCPSVGVTLGSSLSAWYQRCWRQRAFRVPISGCIMVVIAISGVSAVLGSDWMVDSGCPALGVSLWSSASAW